MYVYKKKMNILLFSIVDAIGRVLFLPAGLFRKRKPADIERILVIRLDHIGDLINSTAVLGPLRQKFPDKTIDFLGPRECAGMIEAAGKINNYISFNPSWFRRGGRGRFSFFGDFARMVKIIKSGRYDACVDLRGDFRHIAAMFAAGAKRRISYGITGGGFMLTDEVPYKKRTHEIDRDMELVKALGAEASGAGIDLAFPAEDALSAERIIKDLSLNNYAVIHPIPGHASKRWELVNFLEIAEYLAGNKEMAPVLVGAGDEALKLERLAELSCPKCVSLAGRTNLGELYHIISKASLFVGVDSAPAHMASAAGVPAVVLFSGVNDPDEWAPRGGNVRLVFPGAGKSLEDIKAAEVCGAINEIISSVERRSVW